MLRAVNEIKEFRYRIDSQNRVVYYDTVDMITPIRIHEDGRFINVRISWHADFNTFYTEAKRTIDRLDRDANPYALERGNELIDIVLLSVIPDLYFTSLTCTQNYRHGNNYPLMNIGKVITRDGKQIMPIAITIHHGFVDGYHLSLFFQKIEQYLS